MRISTQRFIAPLLILGQISTSLAAAGIDWFNPFPMLYWTRRNAVRVSLGSPSIWSMEQAHYLLEKNRRSKYGLTSKIPDLDPNEVNSSRIQAMREVLGIAASFDQKIGADNAFAAQRQRENLERKPAANARLAAAEAEVADIRKKTQQTRIEIAALEPDRNELQRTQITDRITQLTAIQATYAATDPNKAKIDAEIEAERRKLLTLPVGESAQRRTLLNDRLTQLAAMQTSANAEETAAKTAASALDTPVTTTAAPDPAGANATTVSSLFTADALKTAIGNTSAIKKEPKLNASTMLDNHVQFSYEMISKQLTLLRDEAGPGNRVVFLELPQSIYGVPGRSEEHLAQTWWTISGLAHIVRGRDREAYAVRARWSNVQADLGAQVQRTSDLLHAIDQSVKALQRVKLNPADAKRLEDQDARVAELTKLLGAIKTDCAASEPDGKEIARKLRQLQQLQTSIESKSIARAAQRIAAREQWLTKKLVANMTLLKESIAALGEHAENLQKLNHLVLQNSKPVEQDDANPNRKPESIKQARDAGGLVPVDLSETRSVELIPRMNALNVSEVQSTLRAFNFGAIFKLLFGLGIKTNYERQSEVFDQFIHQEVYGSAFGKGRKEFGWTFGPVAGSKYLAPGIRTTYAVVVVPESADSLQLTGVGCFYHRKVAPPVELTANSKPPSDVACSAPETFEVQIPKGDNSYWIGEIEYTPVKAGRRATVYLRGERISNQVSVLVDGTPLTGVERLGDSTPASQPVTQPTGSFERISSDTLVASFLMPPDYSGTPQITLIAPDKAYPMNRLKNVRLVIGTEVMKGTTLDGAKKKLFEGEAIKIVSATVDPKSAGSKVTLDIIGGGINDDVKWLLNNQRFTPVITGSYARIENLERPDGAEWELRAILANEQVFEAQTKIKDPLPPIVTNAKVEVKDKRFVVTLSGSHFNANQVLRVVTSGVELISAEVSSESKAVVILNKLDTDVELEIRGAVGFFKPVIFKIPKQP